MKRREFIEKTGGGVCGMMLAYLGLTSCKKGEAETTAAAVEANGKPAVSPAPKNTDPARKDLVKKLLTENMGLSEEETDAKIAEAEETLPSTIDECVCKTCPTFVAEETETAFCHPLVGKSQIITEEKGCSCPQCPVYTKLNLKNGYYCTRKSELEQEAAKKS